MRKSIITMRRVVKNFGPVEQAQIVASAAVVVSMATIISALVVTGQSPRLMDFISIVTVGVIGFTNVYFSLHYSRQLDEQRRQVIALNTIAEAVNQVDELEYVLQTALRKITELLNTSYGWIFMLENDEFTLKCSRGTTCNFMAVKAPDGRLPNAWLHQPRVQRERLADTRGLIEPALKNLGIQFWASIPLRIQNSVVGTLIVAGKEFDMFTAKQADLMEAFGNQINVALHNAQLFDRLKKSEQQYMDLFENAPDMYLSVNTRRLIVGCNNTGATMLGYPKEMILGKTLECFFIEERRDAIRDLLDTQLFGEGRGLKDVQEQMLTSAGRPFHVSLNSTLVFNDRGRAVSARIVARDISERKMMEGAILHAQKIDSIGNLAGGIAHDFNNILAAILGSASIMRRRLTEKSRLYKYVEIMESSARRGSSLTRQLLTFARKTETVVKPVDINGLINETLALFQRSVKKDIVVNTQLASEDVCVRGDDGQLQQSLLNLFLNARDAMPDGGTLSVSTDATIADAHTISGFSSIKPGPFVVITVTDTGSGIEKSIQNRIFEPFFTTKDHGTGLGLSVVYGVVQNHGGFINLESEMGRGTTFTVFLPRVTAATPGNGRSGRRQRIPRGNENILIIDDETSVCEIARDMLHGLGYNVYVEHDGKAGVEHYRTRQANIDLILLDINMPVMGGKETFETLRSINAHCRVIILTGYGKAVIENSLFSSEPNGFMQKPFQLETLAVKVREVLDRKIPQTEPV